MRSPFMPNLYLVNHTRRFMAVCISKNACSTLKWLTLQDDYPEAICRMVPRPGHGLHDFFGYRANGQSLVPVGPKGSAKFSGYLRFAVWRDPVERALSTYRNLVLNPANPRRYFQHKGLINCSLEQFVDFVEEELRKDDPLQMDEHIRPQACYCRWETGASEATRADINVAVPLAVWISS
ncbi:MAG: sulfotransferase family 2 domain-containing protein [Phycisphaerales bacterium JB063]